MREMLLIFEGNEIGEKRAAELIQKAIFQLLDQERMHVKNFVNIAREPVMQVQVRTEGILQIPEFMKKSRDKRTV